MSSLERGGLGFPRGDLYGDVGGPRVFNIAAPGSLARSTGKFYKMETVRQSLDVEATAPCCEGGFVEKKSILFFLQNKGPKQQKTTKNILSKT